MPDLGTFARVVRLTKRDARLLYAREPLMASAWGGRVGYVVGTDDHALRVLLLKLPRPPRNRGAWLLADLLKGELEACGMPAQKEANQYFDTWEQWPEQHVRDVAWLSAMARRAGRAVQWLEREAF